MGHSKATRRKGIQYFSCDERSSSSNTWQTCIYTLSKTFCGKLESDMDIFHHNGSWTTPSDGQNQQTTLSCLFLFRNSTDRTLISPWEEGQTRPTKTVTVHHRLWFHTYLMFCLVKKNAFTVTSLINDFAIIIWKCLRSTEINGAWIELNWSSYHSCFDLLWLRPNVPTPLFRHSYVPYTLVTLNLDLSTLILTLAYKGRGVGLDYGCPNLHIHVESIRNIQNIHRHFK